MAKGASPDCPCGSGARYPACCRPYHRGEKEPADCPTLVRARFSAFALKEVDFLLRSLHPTHPDRARPKEEILRELRRITTVLKFARVRILASREPDADGVARVLFAAEIFESGKDRSFVELSEFRQAEGGWKYVTGKLKPLKEAGPLEALTPETF